MRHPTQHTRLAAMAVLAAALLAAGLPAAAGAQHEPSARALATAHSGGVDLLPQVAYRQAILTVSGNGEQYRWESAPGQPLAIGLFDPAGELLGDGFYKWRLELVPTAKVAARLRAETALNGGATPRPWSAESGSFTIRGGAIVDPDLVEAEPRSAAQAGSIGGFAAAPVAAATATPALAGDTDADAGLRRGRAQPDPAAAPPLGSSSPAAGPFQADSGSLADSDSMEAANPSVDPAQPRTAAAPVVPQRTVSPDGADGRLRAGDNQ